MSELYYAIGDIHGRDDLLEALHERIAVDHQIRASDRKATIVHIGDYVDGGRNSVAVIDRLMRGLSQFDFVCLKGNHEALMLDCLETDNRQSWWNWLGNGGDETLESLGVSLRFGGYDSNALAVALGDARIKWLKSLPLYYMAPDHLFVHAGIAPGVAIESQTEKDLLWIRGRFLNCEDDHGIVVVHGHTPTNAPVVKHNRIGIDIGATSNGQLAAAVLDGQETVRFLTVEAQPGKGP